MENIMATWLPTKSNVCSVNTSRGRKKPMVNAISTASLELEKRRKAIQEQPSRPGVMICGGTGCLALGSDEVAAAFEAAIKEQGLDASVELKTTGCPGFCEQGPLLVVHPSRILYTH